MLPAGLAFLDEYGSGTALRDTYEQDHLLQNQRYISLVALITGVLQLFFLIPDLLHLAPSGSTIALVILRSGVCLASLLFGWFCCRWKIRTYQRYSRLVSGLEAMNILLFLYVFSQYEPPHFIIQAMGLMVIIMVVFLIPNRFYFKLALTVAGLVLFLILSRLILQDSLTLTEFWAGSFYLMIVLFLCAFFSRTLDKHQYLEYRAKDQLIHLNTIDPMTGAHNRNKLVDVWDHWFSWCRRYNQPLTLVLFDVDGFKQINDRHGHSVADTVLIELVLLIRAQLRDTDVLARWGGDEFVILFPNTTIEGARQALDRIREQLRQRTLAGQIPVRCSFGLAAMNEDSTLDSAIREADELMYQGKNSGGDQVHHRLSAI